MPTWNATLALGIPVIDTQHQELFARTDRLLTAMKSANSAGEVPTLLRFLEDYCVEHFSTEEKLMKDMGYPGISEHLLQHTHFAREFGALKARFEEKGPTTMVTLGLQQLICGWLVKHIGTVDKSVAKFLATQRAA